MKGNARVLVLICTIIINGCSTIRHTEKIVDKNTDSANSKTIIIKSIKFSGCSDKEILLKGYAKYYPDSVFIITLLTKQGITAGRGYIWTDSLILINRIKKIYYKEKGGSNYLISIHKLLISEKEKAGEIFLPGEEIKMWKYIVTGSDREFNHEIEIYENKRKICIKVSTGEFEYTRVKTSLQVKEKINNGYKSVNSIEKLY